MLCRTDTTVGRSSPPYQMQMMVGFSATITWVLPYWLGQYLKSLGQILPGQPANNMGRLHGARSHNWPHIYCLGGWQRPSQCIGPIPVFGNHHRHNPGYLVFNDVPATSTVLGSSIIIGSGIYLFHRTSCRTGKTAAAALRWTVFVLIFHGQTGGLRSAS